MMILHMWGTKVNKFLQKQKEGYIVMNIDIARAWKNAQTSEELTQLPENPIGTLELTDEDLVNVDGACGGECGGFGGFGEGFGGFGEGFGGFGYGRSGYGIDPCGYRGFGFSGGFRCEGGLLGGLGGGCL
jgi:mersacidin/lichenicidin family type 2 lantibiotic